MEPVRPLKGEVDTASKIEAPLPFAAREPCGDAQWPIAVSYDE